MGPLEYLVIGFEGNNFRGEIMPELDRLRHEGIIRVLDLLFVKRDEAGEVSGFELNDMPVDQIDGITVDDPDSGWFAQEDIEKIGADLENQTAVALLLIEHQWAIPLQQATQRANGSLLVEGFVPRGMVDQVEVLAHAGV